MCLGHRPLQNKYQNYYPENLRSNAYCGTVIWYFFGVNLCFSVEEKVRGGEGVDGENLDW